MERIGEPASDERAPLPGTTPPSRSARRIVVAVVLAAAALAGLAAWVLVVPYEVTVVGFELDCADVSDGGPTVISNDTSWTDIVEAGAQVRDPRAVRACEDAEGDRRTIALLAGAGVAIAACAVSTVPSRRLTGEKLGPLR